MLTFEDFLPVILQCHQKSDIAWLNKRVEHYLNTVFKEARYTEPNSLFQNIRSKALGLTDELDMKLCFNIIVRALDITAIEYAIDQLDTVQGESKAAFRKALLDSTDFINDYQNVTIAFDEVTLNKLFPKYWTEFQNFFKID